MFIKSPPFFIKPITKGGPSAFAIGKKYSRSCYWLAQTLDYKNAKHIVDALNGLSYLIKEIKISDPLFFSDLQNPEYGGGGFDLILSAVKEAITTRKDKK
jgi:hypothetical protein